MTTRIATLMITAAALSFAAAPAQACFTHTFDACRSQDSVYRLEVDRKTGRTQVAHAGVKPESYTSAVKSGWTAVVEKTATVEN